MRAGSDGVDRLRDCVAIGAGNRYRLAGELTFHGVARPAQGTVHVAVVPGPTTGDNGRAGLRHP
jgi:hypothetical protein